MLHNRAHRVLLLAILLLVSTSLTTLMQPLSSAQSIGQTRTLYFHEFDPELLLAEANVDENPPTSQNDSLYPPKIIVKNSSKIADYKINDEEWLNWFLTSWIFYFFQMQEELNYTDEVDDLPDDFWDLFEGFELFLPHPYRIVELYEYTGEEQADINGSLDFDLYFSSMYSSKMRQKDSVKVGVYSMSLAGLGIPKQLANTTVELSPPLLGTKPYLQRISLGPLNHTLQSEDMLIFSVEILPSNKTLTTFIENRVDLERLFDIAQRIADRLENNTRFDNLREFGFIVNDLIEIIEDETLGINITSKDVAEIFKTFLTTKIVYDSIDHPASVTIPFRVSGEPAFTTYYLLNEQLLNTEAPPAQDHSTVDLVTQSAQWQTAQFPRNKILEEAYARLYINERDLLRLINIIRGKIEVTATIYDDDTAISASTHTFDRTTLLSIGQTPQEPVVFSFADLSSTEITYDSRLRLKVTTGNATQINPFNYRRKAEILFNSQSYPSSLIVQLNETDNIKAEVSREPAEGILLPGGEIKFLVNVTSTYEDTLTIDIREDSIGDWDVSYDGSDISIGSGENKTIPVTVQSTNEFTSAYEDQITLDFVITGKTGRTTVSDEAMVSEDAIIYDIILIGQKETRNIKEGNTGTFYFRIKNNNTGATDGTDSYTILAQSKNNWNVEHTTEITNLQNKKTTGLEEILVILDIPENTTLTKDVLTLTVTSQNNPDVEASINVTINVIQEDIFKQLYERIQSASESIGLDDYFGDNAGYALIGIVFLILAFLVLIILILIRKPFVSMQCTDPIKEIQPNESASFDITLKNPRRKTQTYTLQTRAIQNPSKWKINSNKKQITIPPNTTQQTIITVTPTDQVQSNDWTELDFTARKNTRQTTIHGFIQIKKGHTKLEITHVSNWPKTFKKGNRIITTCHVHNKGTLTAHNIKIILSINGKEKNSVTITIPAGAYAEVQLPWIAGKGRNHLHVEAVEQ